ncbi:MAG: prepilin peptidase [Candidatus Omnitrophica bacterium]|nr:prepilin peptidase [Candidatus Omnitrophota bacterium]MBU2043738.1 prepilin peptidase [Candidatus Omnitrophota bacterium]MBU2251503.1 prepilin peptidase [Candidatus Omnitrophota bacterium]MBU2473707.1 prepilin peptidase [Candidatus Omnitrophota bacterium]
MLEKIAVFILGSCLGSFLNVCIHRLPKEESVVSPRSSCPKCKAKIKWYDNIPLLSYLILRAKCRSCREKIPLRYPLVELITAGLALALYLKFGLSFLFFKFIFFFALLVLVSFIDIDYHAIPVYLCVIGIAVGLALTVWPTLMMLKSGWFNPGSLPLVRAFRGLLFGFGFTYLFKFFGDVFIDFYLKIRKKESIEGERESLGLGDVDFMGMVGVFLGVKSVVLVFFLAPFFAVIYSVFAIIFKRSHLIPYLPYLSLATLTVFFWGDKILSFIL